MRKNRCLALLLVLALLLAGCGGMEELIDDSGVRPYAEQLLQSFVNKDPSACRALLSSRVDTQELDDVFFAVAGEFEGLGEYTMTVTNWQFNTKNGVTTNSYRYLIEAEKGSYHLDVTLVEGEPGFAGFHVSNAEDSTPAPAERGALHWIFLAVGLVGLGFIIWMLVDCARRKMKRKWLWVLLILLLSMVISVTMTQGTMNVRFNIGGYLGLTNLTTYPEGGFLAQFYIPVGALVYCFKRRELTIAEAVPDGDLPEE